MHIPRENSILLSVLAGNFQESQESQITLLKRAGKDFAIIQFPSGAENGAMGLLKDSNAFDRALNNVVEVAKGTKLVDNGIPVAVLSNSLYARLQKELGELTASDIERKKLEIEKKRMESETARKIAEKEAKNAASELQLAEMELTAAEKSEKQVRHIVKELTEFLKECKTHLGMDPKSTLAQVREKLKEGMNKSAGFESMLDKIADET